MISAEYCVLMADYHSWMNRKLYALCAELGDDERRRDRGAFFRSIHGTLNHLMFGDLAVQMFNHATHHRGQLTTLLTQMGRDIGATDIPFMERPDGGRVF